jgi:hypothetical protein
LKKAFDLNCTSTGSVNNMKSSILLPLLMVVGAGTLTLVFTGCKTATRRTSANGQLPASCTLMSLSPEDRAAHQRRLETLRKAARLERTTIDGFSFSVDLRRMAANELAGWMENEQKCCAFLRMDQEIHQGEERAEIKVMCPPELRAQVLETFGLGDTGR